MQEVLNKLGVDFNASFALLFFLLVWVRVLAMASVIPFLFGKPVPRYVLVAASMTLAFFVYPNIVPKVPPPLAQDLMMFVVLFLKEVFYGLVIGFSGAIVFYAYESVGQMIDNQRGVSIARLLIPQLGEQGSISGLFLFQLGMVIYLVLGGHLVFLDAFFTSYEALPVLAFPTVGPGFIPLMTLFMQITGEVLYIALQMSAPVLIAIFLADIILGLANRVAPQINVWELGFHIKGYIGILLLFFALTMIGEQMNRYSMEYTRHERDAIELLQGKIPPGLEEEAPHEEGLPKPESGVPAVKSVE